MGYNTKYTRLNHQEIINDFNKLKSLEEVLVRHNTSKALVEKVLINYGIILPKKIPLIDIDPTKIIERYYELYNTQIVAKEFNISPSSVQKILHKNNVRISVIKYTDEEIIKKYMELKTICATEKELGISESTIRKVLRKYNIKLQTLTRKEIGDVFGKLTIIEEIEPKISSGGDKRRRFILKCECGNLVKRDSLNLTEGKSWHCGCVIKERIIKRNEEQIKKNEEKRILKENYKKLKLIREEEKKNRPKKETRDSKFVPGFKKDRFTILSIVDKIVTVQCDCGTIKDLKFCNFYIAKSCGCSRIKFGIKKYGKWYDRWKSMITRCYKPKCIRYEDYGGRGIKVCDRWLEPEGKGCENYYNDIHNILGPQPEGNYSLDRINNDGNYEITNLRWATFSEQNKNQRKQKVKVKQVKVKQVSEINLRLIKDRWRSRWKSMIRRCYNTKDKDFNGYGGRGIYVCDRWRGPNGVGCRNYYNDIHDILGPQPSPNHSLDRINNDGPYEITNLRWATSSEQSKNQRRKSQTSNDIGKSEKKNLKKKVNIGDSYGNLTVINKSMVVKYESGSSKQFWECKCNCGNTKTIDSSGLISGRSKSCGCRRNKGGKITNKGYKVIYSKEEKKYITEHRHLYENHYDIKLLPHQNVHHMNGDRADNRIENLELWDTSQPKGQRVEDKINYYFKLINEFKDHPLYRDLILEKILKVDFFLVKVK